MSGDDDPRDSRLYSLLQRDIASLCRKPSITNGGFVAVAELAELAGAPTTHRTRDECRARVLAPGGDLYAQLALAPGPPAANAARLKESTGVILARAYLQDVNDKIEGR